MDCSPESNLQNGDICDHETIDDLGRLELEAVLSRIRSIIRRYISDTGVTDHDDLTNIVMLKLLKQGSIEKIESKNYVYSTVRSVISSLLRKNYRRTRKEKHFSKDPIFSSNRESNLFSVECRQNLRDEIIGDWASEILPEDRLKTLYMSLENIPDVEICKITGRKPVAQRVSRFRDVERLRSSSDELAKRLKEAGFEV